MTDTVHLIYFSATKTTQRIVQTIAEAITDGEIRQYDITCLQQGLTLQLTDGLAVIGVPVYAGRVPEICLQRLENLSATGIPAVLVVLYGNREFEDALLELRDVAVSKGFRVIAAGAFIGEHSYATAAQPIAAGRPDRADLQKAREFGERVATCLQEGQGTSAPAIPGTLPYRDRLPLGGIAPDHNPQLCTLCGACVNCCPTSVIRIEGGAVITDPQSCILCCACVRDCPEQARALTDPVVEAKREMLLKNCSRRKEPSLFLP